MQRSLNYRRDLRWAGRSVPVYGSSGFGPNKPVETVIEQVEQYARNGYSLVKLRLGGHHKDRLDLRDIVSALPEGMGFAVDFNEKCTLSQARRITADVLDLGGVFVEEPLPASDLNGYRTLAAALPGTIATGEHLQGLAEACPNVTWLEEFSLLEPMFASLACVDKKGMMSLPKTIGHGISLTQEIDALVVEVG